MSASPPPESPRTLAGAIAHGGLLTLRDLLLNGGVLMSLVVGVGGAVSGVQPWRWLGPVIGVVGVVLSFAGHRERVTEPGGDRRTMMPAPAIWAVAVGIPLLCLAAMWAMWV